MPVQLTELQRIKTSGARAVEAFTVAGRELLAIPQLAYDAAGTATGMNGGDSDTELLLFERVDGELVPFGELPAPGGEDAEFFTIGEEAFLAVASLRTGSGPYRFAVDSTIFRWSGEGFVPFQRVPTYAAKQWRHWRIGDRDFLGLAQGVAFPGNESENLESVVYEWNGTSFVEHQRIPSRWAYNWHPVTIGGQFFVAHAEHLGPSVLYRWNGEKLEPHQTLAAESGRAFASFSDGSGIYLVVACIGAPSRVLRWDGETFVDIQTLGGLGARELAVVRVGGRILVVRVNFILGMKAGKAADKIFAVSNASASLLRRELRQHTLGQQKAPVRPVLAGDDHRERGACTRIERVALKRFHRNRAAGLLLRHGEDFGVHGTVGRVPLFKLPRSVGQHERRRRIHLCEAREAKTVSLVRAAEPAQSRAVRHMQRRRIPPVSRGKPA